MIQGNDALEDLTLTLIAFFLFYSVQPVVRVRLDIHMLAEDFDLPSSSVVVAFFCAAFVRFKF